MERGQFDALARLIAAQRSRRSALAALLGATLLGPLSELGAAKRKGKQRDQRRRESTGSSGRKAKGKAKGKGKNKGRNAKDRPAQNAGAEATRCCATGNCTPGKGKNLAKCCYQDQDLTGKNFSGANLGSANFSRAILTGANLQGANAGKACFVDANLTGVKTNSGTNLGGAIYCRTQTDRGEDNSGCAKGTPCCPTCDAANPCDNGFVCCAGRCVAGDCCGNGDCGGDEVCCGNTCAAGECCAAADCPNDTCQRRSCEDHQCVYTPVFREPGPRCQTICCEDAQGDPVCCAAGTTTCRASGICGCDGDADCGSGRFCCSGVCQTGSGWANQTTFGMGRGAEASQFDFPLGLAVSPDGLTVLAADSENHRVSVWGRPSASSNAWANQAVFGSEGSGLAQFNDPQGVAVSSDGLTAWVADQLNDRVSVWTKQTDGSWANQTTFGEFGFGVNQFRFPHGVAVSPDGLTAWVADRGNDRVSVWTRPTAGSVDWAHRANFGSFGPGADQFRIVVSVAAASDGLSVWVVDQGGNRVSIWTRPSAGSTAWTHQATFGSGGSGSGGPGPDQFIAPSGVAVSPDGLTAWVADMSNDRVSVWTRPNASSTAWADKTTFGNAGNGLNQLSDPQGVAVSPDGLIVWVADTLNHRVSVWGRVCPA